MSVFTTITAPQLEAWLNNYALGTLVELRGIADRAKENTLTIEEMRGASFTISSLEALGVGTIAASEVATATCMHHSRGKPA